MFKIRSFIWPGGPMGVPWRRSFEGSWQKVVRGRRLAPWFRVRNTVYPVGSVRGFATTSKTERLYVGKVPMREKQVERIHNQSRDYWFGQVGRKEQFREDHGLPPVAESFTEQIEKMRAL